MVSIREATTKKELKKFILFPFELYKDDKNWVPPLISDEWKTFDKKKNPSFSHCEAAYFLAYQNNKIVGRVAAIINHKANKTWNDYRTRFGWIAFIDDEDVSKALLDAVEAWGTTKGMQGLHGPLGFTDFDSEGMLVEGFEHQPTITTAYNYPYFPRHLEKQGFVKKIDWVQYKFNASQSVPEKVLKINTLISEKYHVRTLVMSSRKEILKYVDSFFRTLNTSFSKLYGFSELSPQQVKYYVQHYFGFARPELICFVVDEHDEVIGFGISFPSLSKAFQKAKGRLFPFGFIHIIRALRKYDTIDLYLTGVHPDWHRRGIHALYHVALNEVSIQRNINTAFSAGQLETNHDALGIWDNYEKEPWFRTRCFIRD
ncbi:hypothetical protein [Microbacter margulisiae]|uniref:GNAT superfamily N-acetyltransferase n=1 Tax=Microbacter margulisiae TaxID=1350067 RepID=A0A7W5H1U6_9PORP|nr:hypothetical protein [Microbacter margulisiae]MBB3187055.1 GNAT superfamily N-acetyltransferase [Microbacter margulisiae]